MKEWRFDLPKVTLQSKKHNLVVLNYQITIDGTLKYSPIHVFKKLF